MPLESLPNEILGEIIQKLMEEHYSNVYSNPTLSLNRCSRHLYKASISSLYRDVIITGPEMLDLFMKTIANRWELAILVYSLDLTYFDDHHGPYDRDTEQICYFVESVDHTDEHVPPCVLIRIIWDMWGYIDCKHGNTACLGPKKPWHDSLSLRLLPRLEKISFPSFAAPQARLDSRSFCYAALVASQPETRNERSKGPMSALHNLTLEGSYESGLIQIFLQLSMLQTLTLRFLIIPRRPSRPNRSNYAKFMENWTLLRLNITATNISSRYLIPFLKSLKVLETLHFDAHPWQLCGEEDEYNIDFGKIIEGLSHLKHTLRDLRVILGTHAQRSSDFSVLRDFSALTVLEISVWTFLPATNVAMSPILGSALNHVFPHKLQLLKLNCRGTAVCSLKSMIQPMKRLVEEMKDGTTSLKELHLKYFPGHDYHSFASHTECGLYQRHPFLAELSAECQENGITLKVL
ncbi:uncharacterized protein EAF02_005736 [Botrytis sinoallii]|uniref:uncharacterized protein n=1 Tax=Botrytis sinoallii TaxID=1463999 RepID=UPI0019011DA1|nr:uncharacterized protein EAF02_005736 [Botrytis sinoallii]KAF7882373.1 hypothetical protein EAF02_005736 [Botrytis sinoallii]